MWVKHAMRCLGPGVLFPLVLGAVCPSALAWGPVAHRRITLKAIETLPKGLRGFYKKHRFEIPSLQLEAVVEPDGPERHFWVDGLLAFPFPELPWSEAAFRQRFGEKSDAVGRLPWLIQESYERLVNAYKAGDKEHILAESDVLAGLVADVNNPLAVTENADGQKTDQHGLWTRFSVRLPEAMERRLKLKRGAAHYLDAPKRHVMAMVRGSYIWLDNLLYEEELAHRGQKGYNEVYYEAFEARAGGLLQERMSHAAQEVGSFWYTAWTAAGRPQPGAD